MKGRDNTLTEESQMHQDESRSIHITICTVDTDAKKRRNKRKGREVEGEGLTQRKHGPVGSQNVQWHSLRLLVLSQLVVVGETNVRWEQWPAM